MIILICTLCYMYTCKCKTMQSGHMYYLFSHEAISLTRMFHPCRYRGGHPRHSAVVKANTTLGVDFDSDFENVNLKFCNSEILYMYK